jgi:hypothetical protein
MIEENQKLPGTEHQIASQTIIDKITPDEDMNKLAEHYQLGSPLSW